MCKTVMTWNSKTRRWFKKFEGKQYAVSASTLAKVYPELVTSGTKEGTAKAAAKWWACKFNEISRHPNHDEITDAINIRQLMARWCQLDDHEDWRDVILEQVTTLKRGLENRTAVAQVYVPHHKPHGSEVWGQNAPALKGITLDPFVYPANETYLGLGVTSQGWSDNIKQAKQHDQWVNAQTQNDDLATLLEMYLDDKQGTKGHRRNIKLNVGNFISWMGKTDGTTSANRITSILLLNYKKHLLSSEASGHTTSRALNLVKTFIRWLVEIEVIDQPPRNLNSRNLSIPKGHTTPATWTDEQVKLIDDAPDRIKLYLLLSLNCGFYASDIATLTHDNIDWELGRIKAKRHKTGQGGALWFQLWDETFRLLKQERSSHPELALTTADNKVLWSDEDRKDYIGKNWRNWRNTVDDLKGAKIKDLRKTGRSKLDDHHEFARYAPTYRQESPASVDDRYYRAPNQDQFTNALVWLGEQWGFATTAST